MSTTELLLVAEEATEFSLEALKKLSSLFVMSLLSPTSASPNGSHVVSSSIAGAFCGGSCCCCPDALSRVAGNIVKSAAVSCALLLTSPLPPLISFRVGSGGGAGDACEIPLAWFALVRDMRGSSASFFSSRKEDPRPWSSVVPLSGDDPSGKSFPVPSRFLHISITLVRLFVEDWTGLETSCKKLEGGSGCRLCCSCCCPSTESSVSFMALIRS